MDIDVMGTNEQRPVTQIRACRRRPVKEVRNLLPRKYLEVLEQNQKIESCCRHAEDHDIEAFFSRDGEEVPDIYILHCRGCGRQHRRFCVGGGDRPFWKD
jgi:hypothetical protein